MGDIAMNERKVAARQRQIAPRMPQHLSRKVESDEPRIGSPLQNANARDARTDAQIQHRETTTGLRRRKVIGEIPAVPSPHLVPGHPRIEARTDGKRQQTAQVAKLLIEAQAATFAVCFSISRAMPGTASSTCFLAVGRSFS